MLTMNRATLVGHAGRNPETRTLPSGDEVALFSLATNERFKRRDGTEGESTEWHAIVAFGAAARTVRKLVRRGAAVLVEGRIATRTWTDRTGTEHRTSEILVSGPQARVNVLTKRSREPGGGGNRPDGGAPAGPAKPSDANPDDGSADATAAHASGGAADAGAAGDADGTSGAGTGRIVESEGTAEEGAGPLGGNDAPASGADRAAGQVAAGPVSTGVAGTGEDAGTVKEADADEGGGAGAAGPSDDIASAGKTAGTTEETSGLAEGRPESAGTAEDPDDDHE